MVKKVHQYAIIAGSGLQEMSGDSAGQKVTTKYGEPSSPIRELSYDARTVFLLSRHGDDHFLPPHVINYRANMKSLQQLGVNCIVALNTIGVITAGMHPGELAVPNQITDYTYGREHSIYDGSIRLDHIEFTEPLTRRLRHALLAAAASTGINIHQGGVYAATQGPRLETAAEVDKLERDGADYVGMTAMPEASLAMEMGMEYACLSLIVNYAAGRSETSIHADLEASTIAARTKAKAVLAAFFDGMSGS